MEMLMRLGRVGDGHEKKRRWTGAVDVFFDHERQGFVISCGCAARVGESVALLSPTTMDLEEMFDYGGCFGMVAGWGRRRTAPERGRIAQGL
ncbi:MAG: hypothetical protein ACOX9C_09985 [Kiritimatiellia bacterium]